jgi:hypothetical protein
MAFRVRYLAAVLLASVVVATTAPLLAQSLADLARKEEERRKTVKEPAKVYTNKDLGNVAPMPPSTPLPAPDPPAVEGDAAKDAAKDEGTDKGVVKDQAYWAGRVKDLQTQLDRDQIFADALQSRINALTADFTARDDPAQRSVIERDRQKAIAELDRLREAIKSDLKAIADLEDEARRAGVPPGWLR